MQAASFDNYAQEYDKHFTFSAIGKLQRNAVYDYLMPLLNKQKTILEINCGTGYDAIAMAKKAKAVLATDISEKMIEEAQIKKAAHKIENLNFEVRSVQQLQAELANKDLVFSNFGGLNCLSPQDLKRFSEKCNTFLLKKNELLFVIMGRKCIWERFYFTIRSDARKASRRKSTDGVHTVINNAEFNTWYYSPKEIQHLFENNFETKNITGVGLFVPPSYLNPFFENKKILLKIFNAFDKLFCNFKWTADYADHYLIHLKKKN